MGHMVSASAVQITDMCTKRDMALSRLRNPYTRMWRRSVTNQLFKLLGEKEMYSREDLERFVRWAKSHYSSDSLKTVLQGVRWFCREVLGTEPDGVLYQSLAPRQLP